jgi:cobalt transporter subunit CbtB
MHLSALIEDKSQSRPLQIEWRLPAVATLIFGLILVYGIGFAAVPAVHNATHDARHAAGFPCH